MKNQNYIFKNQILSLLTALIFHLCGAHTWGQSACVELFQSQAKYDSSTLEPNTPEAIESRIEDLNREIQEKDVIYSKMTAEFSPELNVSRIKLTADVIDPKTGVTPGSQAHFAFLPGFGGENSYLRSVAVNVGSYAKAKMTSTQKIMNKLGLYIKTSAEGVEQPGRTGAIDLNRVSSIKEYVAWMEMYVLQVKAEIGNDIPFILVGRSGTGTLIWAVQNILNAKYGPGFIAGTISINPVIADKATLEKSFENLIESDKVNPDHKFIFAEIDKWSYDLYREMANNPEYFNPREDTGFRLILLSDKDPQIMPAERDSMLQIASANPNFKVRTFETEVHDILTLASDKVRELANIELYEFLGDIVGK